MAESALTDVVVLELATGAAGPYCGKLLADLGAQVIKVEPAAGDPLRGEQPLVDGESAFFNYLNANKLGAVLSLDDVRIAELASHADIILHSGNHGVVAILAALHARRRTGRGQWIDMSLLEAVAPFFAQQFLEYTVTGEVPSPRGNSSPLYAPQDVYPSFGNDCWLALTVRDRDDWRALCGVIGRADLAGEPAFATAEGRRAHAATIDEAIRAWSAGLDHNQSAQHLQAAGVSAAPVMANWELFTDNHLNDRGFFVPVRHPVAGTQAFPGFPWSFETTPVRVERHAPMFAEHNSQVFHELLHLLPGEVSALYAQGVTAGHPVYAGGPSL